MLVAYLDALAQTTVMLLRGVAVNLCEKARGSDCRRDYTMARYRQDMDSYNNSVGRYRSIGETLKAAWDKAGL